MKLLRFIAPALCAALGLASCTGSGSPFGPSPTPTPQNLANTSLPFYLPLADGNSWTFDDGESINDTGSGKVSCSCPANGISIEELDLDSSSGSYEGSLYFDKQTSNGRNLTDFFGTSTSRGSNLSYISTPNYPDGLPIMDDNPFSESWTDENGDTSTIGSVGQTVTLANGQEAINVASDTLSSGTTHTNFSWQFGQGLGFVTITSGGTTATLSSFNINTTSSFSRMRRASQGLQTRRTFRAVRRMTPADLAVLRKLVKPRR